jgi:hypothetical protein
MSIGATILSRRQSLAGLGVASVGLAIAALPTRAVASPNDKLSDARAAMHKLWEDHITYTRNYIISALADLPDADAVAKRLLANQDELGNAIKPMYGDEAGQKLAALLKDHITIAVDVVAAAKAGDKAKLDAAQQKWSANGVDIAKFLSAANPAWPEADLTAMLQKHLDLTTGEVVARLNQDWEADIKSYDEGHVHMLMFADTLINGAAQQFPDQVA